MTIIGSLPPISNIQPNSVEPSRPAIAPPGAKPAELKPAGAPPEDFTNVIDRAVSGVEEKRAEAAAVTREVLVGENPNLHQAMLAMQEASLSFSLMVEVRNKVIESYKELMRMSV